MSVAFPGSPRALVHALLWAAVIATVLCSQGAAAATIYADGDAPHDGNGTETNPFNNLLTLEAALIASSHSDLTVYFAGTFRGERLFLEATYTNCSYQQWQDKPQAVIRGDVIIDGTWNEVVPGLRYSIPLSGGIQSVVEDWDVRIDAQGRHYGHMRKVNSTAEVESTEGSWFHDDTLSLLHIHASNDENPNTSGRTYARCRPSSAWYLGNHHNCVVDGIHFLLWVDPASGSGYGIFMGAAKDCTIRNCVAIDYGFHGFGFVGPSCTGNTFDRCITRGGRDNGSTGFVFYTQTGSMYGCRAFDCEAHLHHLLDTHGQPLLAGPGWSADGFYAHTGGGGKITDLELQRCVAYGYEVRGGFGFSAGNNVAMPADAEDPASYAVRVYECSLVNGVSNSLGTAARIAFARCDFDLTRMTIVQPTNPTAFNSQPGVQALFESCTIALNTDGMAGASCFRLGNGAKYLLRGCTVYDDGIESAGLRTFFRFTSASSVADASQTVFVHRATQHLSIADGGVSVPASNQRFDHCWYDGIDPVNGYSPNPTFDSLAEFAAGIDAEGIFDIDPQFVDAPDDLEGTETGPLHTTVESLPGVDRLGINLQEYSGHYGAHQYGLSLNCPADLDVDGDVDGVDLALLLGSWGPVRPGSPGDLDDNGVIGGHDLALVLGAWGRCR